MNKSHSKVHLLSTEPLSPHTTYQCPQTAHLLPSSWEMDGLGGGGVLYEKGDSDDEGRRQTDT